MSASGFCERRRKTAVRGFELLAYVVLTFNHRLCCVCNEAGDEDDLILCDSCDRGYHMNCLVPKLDALPEGSYLCPRCAICASCGRHGEQRLADEDPKTAASAPRTPGHRAGEPNVPIDKTASEFHHAVAPTPVELIPRNGKETYTATYCSRCYNDWQGDRFCPVCLGTYAEDQNDVKMVACDKCDRWIHIECDPEMDENKYKRMMDDENAKWVERSNAVRVRPKLTSIASFIYRISFSCLFLVFQVHLPNVLGRRSMATNQTCRPKRPKADSVQGPPDFGIGRLLRGVRSGYRGERG